MADGSIVACLAWVPRGAAKEVPDKVALSKEDLKKLMDEAAADLRAAEGKVPGEGDEDEEDWETEDEEEMDNLPAAPDAASAAGPAVANGDEAGMEEDEADELAKYNFEDYDDEDDSTPGVAVSGAGMGNGLRGLTYHASNEEDPYIQLQEDEEDNDEIEDFRVRPQDNLVVVGRTEDVYSHLEVHVYDEHDEHMYIHHDIMLSSYPLCLEWLDFDTDAEGNEGRGNLIAVGTMSPAIEVWDLDIMDCVEPAYVLGDGKSKRKKKSRGHRAEVMALAANRTQRNVLASGSADTTVKLWDLKTQECLRTYEHHTDKVQSLAWNTAEPTVLMSGAYDRTAQVFDTRNPEAVATWNFAADVESLTWNPFLPYMFIASTEDGFVYAGDTRNPGQSLFTIQAHDAGVSAVTFSQYVPGLMATASVDKTIKIWDIHDAQPKFVVAREMNAGPIFAAKFSPDSPGVLSYGGAEGGVHSMDIFDLLDVQRAFKDRPVTEQPHPVEKRVKADEKDEEQFAGAEDLDDDEDEDESWMTVMQEMQISPTPETEQKEAKKVRIKKKAGGKKSAGGKKKKKK